VLVVPEIALGNVALGPHVAAFGTLTAGAFVVRRALGERAEVYGAGWRALAFVTYCLVGVRLGYHPWRDSAYYTLPVGVVLVGLGAWASRRDASAEPGVLLWLGSLLTAAPLLLHALDNRFVQEVSSVNYDVATLAAGLALALFGLLVQLRAPSAVGAAAVGVDLFVVAFSRIEWNQQTIAAFIAVVGALMILGVWFVAYRRDDLYRLRDAFAAFRRWR
jgi:hypothetical protein